MESIQFDALNSFVTLARTQRMADTTARLAVSRQTVARHLDYLTELFGAPVITREGHRYTLTESGSRVLQQAETLLQLSDALVGSYNHSSTIVDGLEQTRYHNTRGHDYRSQQHPLWRLWQDGVPLLKDAYQAWKAADFEYESPAAQPIKPYLNQYRKTELGWFCSHVGEKSAYARWFGWEWAKSAVGTATRNDPGGPDFDRFASKPYEPVITQGVCRLDHHYVQLETRPDGSFDSVCYQRLILPFLLPDGSPILATVAAITERIEITDFTVPQGASMPPELLMDDVTILKENRPLV